MKCLQEYEVLDLLGKGGFASVYRAKCRKSGMEVAIKMVFIIFCKSSFRSFQVLCALD